jgi:hypothetical protein
MQNLMNIWSKTNMKNMSFWKGALTATLLSSITFLTPKVGADDSKITKGYHTMDAMGCMILRECTDGVKEVFSLLDISTEYSNTDDYHIIADEFHRMLVSLNQIGVKVFLAPDKYFPHNTRGSYHTVSNNFFLNKKWMNSPGMLMSVMRHEGWHVAQDCMAGTIKNSLIAIIKPEEDVPVLYQVLVERTYPNKQTWPWEKEATWAGRTENMTVEALEACASETPMWEVYKPTPLTRKYLVDSGYLDK